jgi:hypothetical protein
MAQLADAGADKRVAAAMRASLTELADNTQFWNQAANGLAVFVTPDRLETWRLPRPAPARVEVADRFLVKPLLPLLAVPRESLLLQLSQNDVRLWLVTESDMSEVDVPEMPKGFEASMVRRAGDAREVRMRQDEDVKVRLQQFVSDVEAALRPVLRETRLPLLLAGVELLVSLYRHVNTYAHLIEEPILGNQDNRPHQEIADQARAVLHRWYEALVTSWLQRVEEMRGRGQGSTDTNAIARAAEEGRIEALVVDIEAELPGRIIDGAIVGESAPSAVTYDVLDELAGRTFRQGGEVLGVRSGCLPNGAKVAAVFRYTP